MMEGRDTLRNLSLALLVFFLVMWGSQYFLPPAPTTPLQTPAGRSDGFIPPESSTPEAGTPPPQQPSAKSPDPPNVSIAHGWEVDGASAEERIIIGANPDAPDLESAERYRIRLELTNSGAGAASATLTDHAESLNQPDRYRLLSPVESAEGHPLYSLTVDRINVDGADLPLSNRFWHVERPTSGEVLNADADGQGESVAFWVILSHDGTPAIRVRRVFRLTPQSKSSRRRDLVMETTLENLSTTPRTVLLTYTGGLGIRMASPRFDDRSINYGIWDAGVVVGHHLALSAVGASAGKLVRLFGPDQSGAGRRLSWVATSNVYFTCIVAPVDQTNSREPSATTSELAALDADGAESTHDDVSVRLVTRPSTLPPGGLVRILADVYLGDKLASNFRSVDEYAARNYYFQVAQSYGWCTFNWLVELMVGLLNVLHFVVRDYGIAIIILVLIVRTLLHPITRKGQVNMVRMQKKMQEMAPKIEEIKRKFANDKTRMNQEIMKLNMNPAGQLFSCLPMVIQMPIWVALYISLSNNVGMRHQPMHGTWIHDLTQPDDLVSLSNPVTVPLFGWEITAFNLLPVLLAIAMYVQQKLQPKPAPNPNMSDQQRQQQEMMQRMGPIMSVMMFLIFYNMPSGLCLYVMSSSFFGAIEQHRIRKHIKEREEDGTLHGGNHVPRTDLLGRTIRRPKTSLLMRLQKMAEEAQKSQSRRPSGDKSRR